MSLVPVLAFAGLVSGAFTDFFIRYLEYGSTSLYPFTVCGSLAFGLAMCAVLWSFGFIPSWETAVALVVATVAVHVVHDFVVIGKGFLNPLFLIKEPTLPIGSRVEPAFVAEHFLVALALYLVFLLALVPGRRKLLAPLVAPGCAALAALSVVYFVVVAGNFIFTLEPLGLVSQTAQAGFLGVGLALVGVEVNRPSRRFALLYAQIGYFVVFGIGVYAASTVRAKRAEEARVRVKAEIAARLEMAPTREYLPALKDEPIDRVFLMDGVGEWRIAASSSGKLPAEPTLEETTFAPRPDRISYYAAYTRTGSDPKSISVGVTQYPNVAWAKFDVLNNPGNRGFQRVSVFGQRIYQDGTYFSWASGSKLIVLECERVTQPVIDEFLKAYLTKYPSEF